MWLARTFCGKISSPSFDTALGQIACYAVAILILVLGLLKLAVLPLTESQLFIGLLLVLAVSLLSVNLGMLLRIVHNTNRD